MIVSIKGFAAVLAVPMLFCLPLTAEAQSSVNPDLPMTTKPLGPQNPGLAIPDVPMPPRHTTGVIAPPALDSRMPIIHPQMPSRMPVIPPMGTTGGNPAVIPK